MNIGEQRLSAKPIRSGIIKFAAEHNATHFISLKPGLHCETRFDPDRELAPFIGKWLERYARRGRGLPNRVQPTHLDLPFMLLVPEMTGRAGASDPHCHGFASLEEGEEPLFRGFLREAWGVDMTVDAARLAAELPEKGMSREQRSFLPNLPVPVATNPSGWVVKGARFSPTFDLQPITDLNKLASYITKKTTNPNIWITSTLLDTPRPSQPKYSKSPARIRH